MASAPQTRSGPRSRSRSESQSRSMPRRPDPAAGTGVPTSAATGPVTPRLQARRVRGGSFALQRMVLLELAVALTVCGWLIGSLVLVPSIALAVLLVLLAVVRRRRQSLPEWLAGHMALRARLRRAANTPVASDVDAGLAPAVECEPNLRTYNYVHRDSRDRRPVGMLGDGGFLTAVLQVEADAGALRADRGSRPLPLALVRDALDVDGIRLESAQVVLHTQTAPAPHLPRQSVVVTNYAQLQTGNLSPAVRIMWIALKLDPELCPDAVAARGGGLTGAQKCLARSAEHLSSRLTGAGFRVSLLTEEELPAALSTSMCANPMVAAQTGQGDAPRRRTEESGRSWRCDNRRHTTYWVRRWPQLGGHDAGLPQLVARLTAVPALATTFSLTLAPSSRQDVTITGHVRVTGRSSTELAEARRGLEHAARQARTALVRLDREQLAGMLATLPLGGAR
ncbi:type VII secretion protein EccE [Streptomyces sp. WAC 04229]|uniref:type VII secretion protein EccE n=1 Tax=Streptomyces sp. WAC 04229 TaxID=2203206 RepID=UPI000F739D19|nr:type VII secretion protein EccE [Streptomyces sp. WAC 04229]RSN52312.1 type VII secretion protein EccE [Streptomyces sp. WAC 04229]